VADDVYESLEAYEPSFGNLRDSDDQYNLTPAEMIQADYLVRAGLALTDEIQLNFETAAELIGNRLADVKYIPYTPVEVALLDILLTFILESPIAKAIAGGLIKRLASLNAGIQAARLRRLLAGAAPADAIMNAARKCRLAKIRLNARRAEEAAAAEARRASGIKPPRPPVPAGQRPRQDLPDRNLRFGETGQPDITPAATRFAQKEYDEARRELDALLAAREAMANSAAKIENDAAKVVKLLSSAGDPEFVVAATKSAREAAKLPGKSESRTAHPLGAEGDDEVTSIQLDLAALKRKVRSELSRIRRQFQDIQVNVSRFSTSWEFLRDEEEIVEQLLSVRAIRTTLIYFQEFLEGPPDHSGLTPREAVDGLLAGDPPDEVRDPLTKLAELTIWESLLYERYFRPFSDFPDGTLRYNANFAGNFSTVGPAGEIPPALRIYLYNRFVAAQFDKRGTVEKTLTTFSHAVQSLVTAPVVLLDDLFLALGSTYRNPANVTMEERLVIVFFRQLHDSRPH
jgi:hypothetical protein